MNAPDLTLTQAQQQAWLAAAPPPQTVLQALGQLEAVARQARQAFEAGHDVATQRHLEETLLHGLLAMRMLDVSAAAALTRALQRRQQPAQTFVVHPDKVELFAQGEVRGSWALYGEEDYRAALRLARELDCEVIHTDSEQLALFQ